MNLTDTELIIVGITILSIIYYFYKKKEEKDEYGRINDDAVTVDNVIEALDSFKPKLEQRLKEGFTEVSIQKQLFNHLEKEFVHVNREQGIEGVNATKIDFDIGRGKVGIEVKLARSLFKTSGLHRLVGQLKEYTENKYDEENLIVIVFGTNEESKERVHLSKIEETVEDIDCYYMFAKVPTKKTAIQV